MDEFAGTRTTISPSGPNRGSYHATRHAKKIQGLFPNNIPDP